MLKNSTDSYPTYLERWGKENAVPKKDFIVIVGLFMKFIMKKVIMDGDELVLPFKTGTLSVMGFKQKVSIDSDGTVKGLSPNWKKTKELYDKCPECKERRQIIYNTNEHSDGIRYKFHWSLANVLLQNKNFYTLKFSRENKRKLSAEIFNGREYISLKTS